MNRRAIRKRIDQLERSLTALAPEPLDPRLARDFFHWHAAVLERPQENAKRFAVVAAYIAVTESGAALEHGAYVDPGDEGPSDADVDALIARVPRLPLDQNLQKEASLFIVRAMASWLPVIRAKYLEEQSTQ